MSNPDYKKTLDALEKLLHEIGEEPEQEPEKERGLGDYFTLFSGAILASLINQLLNLALCCYCAATVNRALDVFEVPIVFTMMQVAGTLIAISIAFTLPRMELLASVLSLSSAPKGINHYERTRDKLISGYYKSFFYKVLTAGVFSLAWVLMPLIHKLASLLISTN